MPPRTNFRPLSGVRVLVGRARHQASVLSGALRKLGASVVEIPFIQIRKPRSFKPFDAALKNIHSYDWLILTSVNGVEALWERLTRLRLKTTILEDLEIAAIGPATKKAFEQRGIKVDVVPKEYVAESVVRSLRLRAKGKRVLLVRAKVARDVIPRELRRAGASVDVVEAYETVVPQFSGRRLRSLLKKPHTRPQVITFTSSSTVRNFVALLGGSRTKAEIAVAFRGRGRPRHASSPDGVQLASIGPVTSSTLRDLGLPVDIQAKEFSIPGLVDAIVRAFAGPRRKSPRRRNRQDL